MLPELKAKRMAKPSIARSFSSATPSVKPAMGGGEKKASCKLSNTELLKIGNYVRMLKPEIQIKLAELADKRLNEAAALERVFGYKYASLVTDEHMTKIAIWSAIARALPTLARWGTSALNSGGKALHSAGNWTNKTLGGAANAGGVGGAVNRQMNIAGNNLGMWGDKLLGAGKSLGTVGTQRAQQAASAAKDNLGGFNGLKNILAGKGAAPAAAASAAPAAAAQAAKPAAQAASAAPQAAGAKPQAAFLQRRNDLALQPSAAAPKPSGSTAQPANAAIAASAGGPAAKVKGGKKPQSANAAIAAQAGAPGNDIPMAMGGRMGFGGNFRGLTA